MTTAQESKPIVDILRRVGGELGEAAAMIEDLHRLFSNIDRACISQNAAFMQSAQSIDIVQQRLNGLSHFVNELAELMPSHWLVESHAASRKVQLSHLAARLNHHDKAAERLAEHPVGDMELF